MLLMLRNRRTRFLAVVAGLAVGTIGCFLALRHNAKKHSPDAILARADDLAWHNDWMGAAPLYAQAETLFRKANRPAAFAWGASKDRYAAVAPPKYWTPHSPLRRARICPAIGGTCFSLSVKLRRCRSVGQTVVFRGLSPLRFGPADGKIRPSAPRERAHTCSK